MNDPLGKDKMYEYDAQGRVSKIKQYDPVGKKEYGFILEYDSEGKLIKAHRFRGDNLSSGPAYQIEYNDQGLWAKTIRPLDLYPSAPIVTTAEYNEKGQLIKLQGLGMQQVTYEYTGDDLSKKLYTWPADTSAMFVTTYQAYYPDKNNNLKAIRWLDLILYSNQLGYDTPEGDRLVKSMTRWNRDFNHLLTFEYTYAFNAQGQVTKITEVETSPGGQTWSTTFDYKCN